MAYISYNNKPDFRSISVLLVVISLSLSCKKLVDVDPPVTRLVTATVFNNDATATGSVLSIYGDLTGYFYSVEAPEGLLGDELKYYQADLKPYYVNNVLPSNINGNGIWFPGYRWIYRANAAFEALQQSTGVTPAAKQQLMGECKFIRAFCLFHITAVYGDIPLPLSSDYSLNSTLTRTPQADVFNQIIADLKDAQNLLNAGYVDGSDVTVYPIASAERVRPTKAAASALLARVYLYQKDYVNAEAQASAVINNTSMFGLLTDLNQVFLKNSKEAIWQIGLIQPYTTSNTVEALNFILTAAPTKYSLSSFLLNSFENTDQRRVKWVGTFTAGSNTYYFPYKYKVQTLAAPAAVEYTMILRLAEQYLIRAEAEANGAGAGLNGAVNDLNVIRNRAGLPNYSGTVDKPSLLTAILHERQVELFTEGGHRWMDLIRTGTINTVMSVVTPAKGGVWSADGHQALLPLPQSDITSNYRLTQNPGY